MAEIWEPIGRYRKAGHPLNNADPSGGVKGASIVDGEDDFIPSQPIPTSGGDLKWYYAEGHVVENGGGNPVPAPGWYVKNGLTKPTAATPFQVVADDPTDVGILRLTFISDSSGLWDVDEITLNGTTTVVGALSPQVGTHVYVESVSSGGALEAAASNRFIYNNSVLMGKILQGRSTADSLHRIAVGQTVNNNYVAANRLTDPNVASPANVGAFTSAYSVATRIQLPSAIDVANTEEVDIWWEVTAPEDMPAPIGQLEPVLTIYVLT